MNIKLDIPENFYRGEEKCGYYVSPEMKKVWAVELDLIAEFARVCEKHNIKWYMDGGTLLGAVRHKGFIPWDDDVDVILMRDDYEKLLKIADEEFKYPYYFNTKHFEAKLHNETTTMIEWFSNSLMKAGVKLNFSQGIFIDIFPLDNLPNDKEKASKLLREAAKYGKRYEKFLKWSDYYIPSQVWWKRPIKDVLYRWFKYNNIARKTLLKFFDIVKSCKDNNSEHIAKLIFISDPKFLNRRIWERSYFDETVYLPFEMFNLPAPSGWKNILDQFYGNWRKYYIRGKHAYFYDTEHSYKYYLEEGHSIDDNSI